MTSLRNKYESDIHFKTLVDFLVNNINTFKYSPSEMREAAMLASIIYESTNVSQMVYIESDIEESLRFIHARLDKE